MNALTNFIKLVTAIISLGLVLAEVNYRVTGEGPSPVTFVQELAEARTSPSSGPSSSAGVDQGFEESREAFEREQERVFDLAPPTSPGNLRIQSQDGCSITMEWDASTDDEGIEFYEVFENGRLPPQVVRAPTTQLLVKLSQGETSDMNVVARDTSVNKSSSSNVLNISC